MVQQQTKLNLMDNSGASIVQCIKTLGGFNRTFSYSGDIILISIKKLRLTRKVKTGEIYFAIITRTKKQSIFKDGSNSKFNNNTAIILNNKKKVLGTRLFGSISRKLRKKKFLKVMMMCGKKMY
ncbi:MAG: 50S ribosomal protein L14 [Rickettsiales bacterium]|nr:50S ribosomal protein L14 [Rickettsiales bacterium]